MLSQWIRWCQDKPEYELDSSDDDNHTRRPIPTTISIAIAAPSTITGTRTQEENIDQEGQQQQEGLETLDTEEADDLLSDCDDKGKEKHQLAKDDVGSSDNKKQLALTSWFTSNPWIQEHLWNTPVGEFLTTMGACLSGGGGAPIIQNPDGNEQDFHNRYIEDRVLGEGEFGVVKLVHDMSQPGGGGGENSLACKTLRKGVQFKDNTLYAPLKAEVLQCEVDILRTLAGGHYCLGLMGVFETSRSILMVTEYCAGGEMMEYVANQEEDLRTDDVSRIAFQMLDAVDHCAKHDIIHRDIKPENVMFVHPTPGSDLRLIDFGSGTNKVLPIEKETNEPQMHTTFAGSAFYISPEMFQRTYTQKTDVWSVGVALYVLVAGYPADVLQRAFNMLHTVDRNLRKLPNMPEDMPDSYFDLLDGALVYRHKKRKTAGELLDNEFVQFHKDAFSLDNIAMEANKVSPLLGDDLSGSNKPFSMRKTQSISLKGSVGRHSLFLDYQKFERSLTTLLATLLDRKELQQLLDNLTERMGKGEKENAGGSSEIISPAAQTAAAILPPEQSQQQKLDVIQITELKKILEENQQAQV